MEFRDELDNIILLPAPRLSSTLTTEFSTRPSRKTKISASSILAYMKINFGHDFCTIYTISDYPATMFEKLEQNSNI
jgi:hypothetical protein